jgi:hypothetical protein
VDECWLSKHHLRTTEGKQCQHHIENKKRGATVGGGETGCVEKMGEMEEQCTSCLLKFIKGLIEAANMVGAG